MPNINSKTYVDIHTIGKRLEFSSLRAYDRFLKKNNVTALTKNDIEKIKERRERKTDYKKIAEECWKEKDKYIPEIKERIAREQYRQRNGHV